MYYRGGNKIVDTSIQRLGVTDVFLTKEELTSGTYITWAIALMRPRSRHVGNGTGRQIDLFDSKSGVIIIQITRISSGATAIEINIKPIIFARIKRRRAGK